MELRRINFCANCGDDSCGSCGCSPQTKSFEQSLKGSQGVQGAQGLRGLNGKNNVLNGSELLDSSGGNQNGTDEALGGSVTSALTTAGFDPITKPTLVATVDTTDITNTKYWVRMSNAFMNFIYNGILPRLLPSGGTTNQILKKTSGTDYAVAWANQTGEVYNTTSPVNTVALTSSIVNTTLTFTVAVTTSYVFGNPIRLTDANSESNYIDGIVAVNNGSSLEVNVTNITGSGTPNSWIVGLGSALPIPYFNASTNQNRYLYNNGSILLWGLSIIPTGVTMVWWSSTAPAGFLICDGSLRNKVDYPDLYELLYPHFPGVADVSFYLPNFTGRVPVGRDAANANIENIGDTYGSNDTTLVGDNLPEIAPYGVTITDPGHNHNPEVTFDTGGNEPLRFTTGDDDGLGQHDLTNGSSGTGITAALTTNTGNGGTAFSNFQPSLVCTWIIKI